MTVQFPLNPAQRIDFAWFFDVEMGNPNGDPDRDNAPRQDHFTGHGEVSNACLKRKIRDRVMTVHNLPMWVQRGAVLNDAIAAAYGALALKPKGGKSSAEQQQQAQGWMQENYWDVRVFGGVMSTGMGAGQCWGPVQVADARSVHPIHPENWSITRVAATEAKEGKDNKTMGRKWIVPYGLYRTVVTYNPSRHELSAEDLNVLVDAMVNAFELDRSATRGIMGTRHLFAFEHGNRFGSARLSQLLDGVAVTMRTDPPTRFSDFDIAVAEPPEGVTLIDCANL